MERITALFALLLLVSGCAAIRQAPSPEHAPAPKIDKHSFCNVEGQSCGWVDVSQFTDVPKITINFPDFSNSTEFHAEGCIQTSKPVVSQAGITVHCDYERGTEFSKDFYIFNGNIRKSGRLFLMPTSIIWGQTSASRLPAD